MGFTTEELQAFRDVEVPDLLPEPPDPLKLLFVGINPGPLDGGRADPLRAPGQPLLPGAARRRHRDRAGEPVGRDDRRGPRPVPQRVGSGITNLVSRASARASELTRGRAARGR